MVSAALADSPVILAVGPEGGWADEELELFAKSGWTPASLGPTILRAETGSYVKVMDPYTIPETLDLLALVRAGTMVQVLCGKRTATPGLRSKAEALRRGGLNIEVRVDAKGVFHDRFIATERGVWSVGQSLSDFGRKASYLSRIDEPRSLEQYFEECWASANEL